MAGAAGTVRNNTPFASFVIRNWQDWMTRAVVEHAAGAPIALLRERYGRTDEYLRNIMNTQQAREIITSMNSQALRAIHATAAEKIQAANAKALDRTLAFLNDDDLAQKAPATVWGLSLKTLDTLKPKHEPPPPTFNQQNNYYLAPEVLSKLKAAAQEGLSALPAEIPSNYESPASPTGRTSGAILGSGVRQSPYQGQDGPSVPLQLRLESSDEL